MPRNLGRRSAASPWRRTQAAAGAPAPAREPQSASAQRLPDFAFCACIRCLCCRSRRTCSQSCATFGTSATRCTRCAPMTMAVPLLRKRRVPWALTSAEHSRPRVTLASFTRVCPPIHTDNHKRDAQRPRCGCGAQRRHAAAPGAGEERAGGHTVTRVRTPQGLPTFHRVFEGTPDHGWPTTCCRCSLPTLVGWLMARVAACPSGSTKSIAEFRVAVAPMRCLQRCTRAQLLVPGEAHSVQGGCTRTGRRPAAASAPPRRPVCCAATRAV